MLHDKYHNKNHHTTSRADNNTPDAGLDSIASHDDPFRGDFVTDDTFVCTYENSRNLAALCGGTVVVSSADIGINSHGSVFFNDSFTVNKLILTDSVITLPMHQASTTDKFLCVTKDEHKSYLRLWKLHKRDVL